MEDKQFSTLIYEVGFQEAEFINKRLKKYRIKMTHARILKYISENSGCGQKQVGEALNYQPASLANMLKRLEVLGMIRRTVVEGSHPLQKCLYLTDKGQEVIIHVHNAFVKLDGFFEGQLDEHSRAQIAKSLKRLVEANC